MRRGHDQNRQYGPRHFVTWLSQFASVCPEHGTSLREDELPVCCQKSLAQRRWWANLEAAAELQITAANRYKLCTLIDMFEERETLRGPLPDGALLDDFLAAIVLFYKSLGGTPKLTGAFYRKGAAEQSFESEQPFERFALHIWSRLPRDQRPATEGAMIARLRMVMSGRVDWARESGSRTVWDSRAGLITMRVTASVTLGGVKPGETITVPARLNFEKPRRLEPVSAYWRERLREGSVRVSHAKSGTTSM
jgi:hypothetical protein